MNDHNAVVRQLDLVGQRRQDLDHFSGGGLRRPRARTFLRHGLVSTHGPLEVTATVCSKWAA